MAGVQILALPPRPSTLHSLDVWIITRPQPCGNQVTLLNNRYSLCGYYNEDVLEMLENKMLETGFYLRNRWMLESLVNGDGGKEKGVGDKIKSIVKRFDDVFVNGGGLANNTNDKSSNNK